MNVKTLKNEVQLKLELHAMAQPAVDAAAGNANNAAARVEAVIEQSNAATQNANSAASSANTATNEAWTAAQSAQKSATAADQAAANAHTEALLANAAAANANTAAQSAHSFGTEAVSIANAAAQEAVSISTTAANAANEAAAKADAARELLQGDLSALLDPKANVIIDTSAKAASHSLHAQDGRLGVTLYGKTTETGTGDKSPDNPYVISGVNAAQIHSGSANLIPNFTGDENWDIFGLTATKGADGAIILNGTVTRELSVRSDILGVQLQKNVKYTLSNEQALPAKVYLSVNNNPIMISPNGTKKTASVTEDKHLKNQIYIWASAGAVFENTVIAPMLVVGEEAVPYEPYNANVITPALLPDGAPLMGNSTVMDTVENDVLSGCDKTYTFNGTEGFGAFNAASWNTCAVVFASNTLSDIQGGVAPYSDRFAGRVMATSYSQEYVATHSTLTTYMYLSISFERLGISPTKDPATGIAAIKAYLAANPLTVFYRSTEYTPDKDLRVCKTVRKWKTIALDGTEAWSYDSKYDGFKVFGLNAGSANYVATIDNGTYICGQLPIVNNVYPMTGNGLFPYNMSGNTFILVRIDGINDLDSFKTYLAGRYANGNPIEITFRLATPETYMSNPLDLRKPTGITPVTVTGSGETAVTYPHDTKHYIDQKFDALAAALLS